ncbi:MAG: cation:proton antiporter [Candidatus Aenigmatarchaeota archaeon]
MEEMLLRFLVIITVVFFIPKVVYHIRKIPYPITEVVLGIVLGILVPSYFFADDVIKILASLGIITIFVCGGMEINIGFIKRSKKMILQNAILQIVLLAGVATFLIYVFTFTTQVGLILALALIVPSAGYVFSFVRQTGVHPKERNWVEGIVICSEILGILLLLIFLNMDDVPMIALSLIVITLLVTLLPKLLDFLYTKVFKKMIGLEFAFIFVVALISAYITEAIGVHFIIGAFIAGIVAKRFIDDIRKDGHITNVRHMNITEGFSFFSQVFAPFYFFSVGLMLSLNILTVEAAAIAIAFVVGATAVRFTLVLKHRRWKMKETYNRSFNIAVMTMPTIVFTFVIADILHKSFGISDTMFGALLLYGIMTAIVPLILMKKAKGNDGDIMGEK